ncbi:MAG: DUF1697 domain-containing protein [Pseudomonadota bacterium]
MKTYVLLFRGINVGGKNLLPMKELTAVLERCGMREVRTYIQSGNAVLKSSRLPGADLSTALADEFGFEPELLAIESSKFTDAVSANPFDSADGKLVHFYFCKSKPAPDEEKISRFKLPSEELRIINHVAYLYAPDGIGRSKLVSNVEACLGVRATGRNLNTINRLQKMIIDAG